MNLNFSGKKNRAITVLEVLVVFACLLVFAALILPPIEPNRRRAEQVRCINNLRQINLAYRVWAQDSQASYRVWEGESGFANHAWLEAMKTNADTVGLNGGQIGWVNVMRPASNILSSSKILECPADHETPTTTNSTGRNIRISYFLNLDASERYRQEIFAGDDNLAIDGVATRPGILGLSSNTPVSWASGRHGEVNNIGLADGSIEQQSSSGLQKTIQYSFAGTPNLTNRIAIP